MHRMSSAIEAPTPAPVFAQDRPAGRPLRVLQVIASVAVVNGGASTAIWSTLKALGQRGVDTELVTTNEDGPDRLMDIPLGEFIQQDNCRVRYFPSKGDRYTTSWPLARWLLDHVRDYDVVHVHGLFRFAPVAAAHAAALRGVPYVLTPHNTLGHWGLRYRRPLLKKLSIGLIEGRMLDRARRVHLCSTDELDQVGRVRKLGARGTVFPLGIDLAEFGVAVPPTGKDPLGRRPLSGRKIILFMSRIHQIKGLDSLLSAFATLQDVYPDTDLVVAGTGDEKLSASLRELARTLGIENRTHWAGFAQGSLKQDLLESASVFVLPSRSENFGYAAVEAMVAGLPVITTVNVPTGEFVAQASAGIVYDGTTSRLVESLHEILAMPEAQRLEMGRRGSESVRHQLSLATFGESLERCYREACSPAESLVEKPVKANNTTL
jgi:glycosyltransferase involved in cell wall biosynthesis